jgi:transketolase
LRLEGSLPLLSPRPRRQQGVATSIRWTLARYSAKTIGRGAVLPERAGAEADSGRSKLELPVPSAALLERNRIVARGIRVRVLEHTLKNSGGYLSQACSSAEILAALYGGVMNLAPVPKPLVPSPFAGVPSAGNTLYRLGNEFNGPHQRVSDRFILSPTHYSLILYAALIETGRMDPDGLAEFNRDGSSVEMIGAEHSPGMEVMTGSLGQGLSQGIGMAFGRRLKQEPGKIWLLMSDGEFQIGMVWEAFQFMSHYGMDSIGVYVDVNRQQCDGAMSSVMGLAPLADKLVSFGAEVVSVDGHDLAALHDAALTPHAGKPLVVLCETDPCREVPELRNLGGKLHYVRIKNEVERGRYEAILATLGRAVE